MDNGLMIGHALERARAAFSEGNIPVGCIIADENGEIIAGAQNGAGALDHAELSAIRQALALRPRLDGLYLFTTLEPCPMCAGAINAARIKSAVFGAYDPNAGAFGGAFDLNQFTKGYHCRVTGGVSEDECSALMSEFFKNRR